MQHCTGRRMSSVADVHAADAMLRTTRASATACALCWNALLPCVQHQPCVQHVSPVCNMSAGADVAHHMLPCAQQRHPMDRLKCAVCSGSAHNDVSTFLKTVRCRQCIFLQTARVCRQHAAASRAAQLQRHRRRVRPHGQRRRSGGLVPRRGADDRPRDGAQHGHVCFERAGPRDAAGAHFDPLFVCLLSFVSQLWLHGACLCAAVKSAYRALPSCTESQWRSTGTAVLCAMLLGAGVVGNEVEAWAFSFARTNGTRFTHSSTCLQCACVSTGPHEPARLATDCQRQRDRGRLRRHMLAEATLPSIPASQHDCRLACEHTLFVAKPKLSHICWFLTLYFALCRTTPACAAFPWQRAPAKPRASSPPRARCSDYHSTTSAFSNWLL